MLEQITGKYTLKQIFEDHWPHFLSIHKVRDSVKENVEKMMNCGDRKKLGYGLYVCKKCNTKHHVAHTCKSRFCNSCGKITTDNWIKKAQKRFVNVPHHHIVFSSPSELWLLFRREPITSQYFV